MTQFFQAASALAGETIIALFEVDLNPIGANVLLRFCKHAAKTGTSEVVFLGNTYTVLDVEATGFEWNAQGPVPQPTLRISNVTNIVSSLLRDYRDLIGAKVTRIRTFERFLSGGEDASLAAQGYTTDIFNVERKSVHNKQMVEWKLSAAMDQEGRMLPSRLILRDSCAWRYRVWNAATNSFDYSKATCPYTAAAMFNMSGVPVSNGAEDVCSKRVETGCKARYGIQVLPFGGFPAVARVR